MIFCNKGGEQGRNRDGDARGERSSLKHRTWKGDDNRNWLFSPTLGRKQQSKFRQVWTSVFIVLRRLQRPSLQHSDLMQCVKSKDQEEQQVYIKYSLSQMQFTFTVTFKAKRQSAGSNKNVLILQFFWASDIFCAPLVEVPEQALKGKNNIDFTLFLKQHNHYLWASWTHFDKSEKLLLLLINSSSTLWLISRYLLRHS